MNLQEQKLVHVSAGPVELEGNLSLPSNASGIVLFAHGSGSSRHSPRNRFVAEQLQRAGLATLLIDLLTAEEEIADRSSGHLRFNIQLLAQRLGYVTDWLKQNPSTRALKIGYFGASTGAGAALLTAADHPQDVAAIVSRGGRPDLAGDALLRVKAPTLLIVGGEDHDVIRLNETALAQIPGEKRLDIILGATHLFEESGTLEQVASLARQWFERYLISTTAHPNSASFAKRNV
ncbi:dienelactone hydrolase family protein [Methylobacter svalbardensis]|uniref:dienelactone hydrolase family protein n=1 Tax=Methylobacter svalbardensis TaxID=3080016 RepID=UPI0030EC6605